VRATALCLLGLVLAVPANAQDGSTLPASDGGAKCAGNKCVAWVQLVVPKFEHVTIDNPPCAINPNQAVDQIADKIIAIGIAVGSGLGSLAGGIGSVPGGLAGGMIGSFVAEVAAPNTPLGQFLNPPSNQSRCFPVAVVIPPDAVRGTVRLWANDTSPKPPVISVKPLPPVPPKMNEVNPSTDTAFSRFDMPPQEKVLVKDGKPIGTLVWTVFKNWSGGWDRRVGMTVEFVTK
jgi:hypothetical protein